MRDVRSCAFAFFFFTFNLFHVNISASLRLVFCAPQWCCLTLGRGSFRGNACDRPMARSGFCLFVRNISKDERSSVVDLCLLCFSQHASVIMLRWAWLNKGFRGMLLLLEQGARGRKELVIAVV